MEKTEERAEEQANIIGINPNKEIVLGLSIQQWIDLETKEQNGTMWGVPYCFSPVIAETIVGDGKQLVYFGTMDQRPYYWLLRIDSKTDIESNDFDIESLLEPLEEEFGNYPDGGFLDEEEFHELKRSGELEEYDSFEDYDSECKYPAICYGGGHYGLIVNMVTGQVGSEATIPKL